MSDLAPGAFAYPVSPDNTFGALSAEWDEVGGTTVIDPAEAVAAETQNQVALEGYMAQLQVAVFTGILNVSGGALFAHNLADADGRVWHVGAFYRTAANQATTFGQAPLVGVTNIALNGGIASAPYRCVLLLLPTRQGW